MSPSLYFLLDECDEQPCLFYATGATLGYERAGGMENMFFTKMGGDINKNFHGNMADGIVIINIKGN